ncbi:MAG: MFS transporter [Candidatus Caldarchaeales archaeon]
MDRRLVYVFIALGIVSLLADITYEGARSISGAYLNFLAAPAIAAGLLAAGEFLSYLIRFLSGLIAQKTYSAKTFWSLIYIGYAVNLFAIPLLAFTNYWFLALILYFVERMGKGLRTPIRDVLVAEISEGIGRGKGFGIHEVVDQVGAIAGPAIIGLSLTYFGDNVSLGYRYSFIILGVPAALSLITLTYVYSRYPVPRAVDVRRSVVEVRDLGRVYWLYLAGSSIAMAGLIHWGLVSYYLEDLARTGEIFSSEIPIFYLIAMASDAIIALPLGIIYDRYKYFSLSLVPITAIPIPILLFIYPDRLGLYAMSIIWGASMGGAETIMRAAVADITRESSRLIAYGLSSMLHGASMFLSGIVFSYLYQIRAIYLIIFLIIIIEIIALTLYSTLMIKR